MDNIPVCTANSVTNILNASVMESHGASTASATIEAESTTLTLGDEISIVMGDGYSTGTIFTGYVKQIDKKVPENTCLITANDKLVRAIEYFIAPSDPDNTYKRHAIQAETLIGDLLAMAGLTNYSGSTTYFTIANTGEVEVNLVSAYDYSKAIADLLAWHLWMDRNGVIYFKNRKPFVMNSGSGCSGEVGYVEDSAVTPYIYSANVLNIERKQDEKDLRNRIVVYGSGCHAEASSSSPYLPGGFYKTAVVGAELMLDTTDGCQRTADYNLTLYNRLTTTASCSVAGVNDQWKFKARTVSKFYVYAEFPPIATGTDAYIYSVEHNFSNSGYITNLDLRI